MRTLRTGLAVGAKNRATIYAAILAAMLAMILLTAGAPAHAHRLDEYLQATTLSVTSARVHAQMRLTPGVAVFAAVFAGMDADGDGLLSQTEQRAYAERTLGDLALMVDGERLRLHLMSCRFAPVGEMKEGRGEVQIEFEAEVSRRAGSRRLVFENHHQSKIPVYLVNCLVPTDPNIQVTGQKRNYGQSRYELEYTQAGAASPVMASEQVSKTAGERGRMAGRCAALLLCAPLAWLWRRRIRAGRAVEKQAEDEFLRERASPKGRDV